MNLQRPPLHRGSGLPSFVGARREGRQPVTSLDDSQLLT
jgi:hypothetical protein